MEGYTAPGINAVQCLLMLLATNGYLGQRRCSTTSGWLRCRCLLLLWPGQATTVPAVAALAMQVDTEQYFIARGEFDPQFHLQYLTGYKFIGGSYVAIDRLLPVSACPACCLHDVPPSVQASSWSLWAVTRGLMHK
jgi:hypothetical protein